MRAVFESGGKQYNAQEGDKIRIPKIDAKEGEKVIFDKVLLCSKSNKSIIGAPYIKNAQVEAKVLSHAKEEKVTVFKFKRRTKYRRKKGHRQDYTEVEVKKIKIPKTAESKK